MAGAGDIANAGGSSTGRGAAAGMAGGNGEAGKAGNAGASGKAGNAGAAGSGLLPKSTAPVLLGTAGHYVMLATSAINNAPPSAITGDIGLSPQAATGLTGLSLSATVEGTRWTSSQVKGWVYAADAQVPTPSQLTLAMGDMGNARTAAAARSPEFVDEGSGKIGGLTLAPGVHRWTTSVNLDSDVSLQGAADDVWIFQVSGTLQTSASRAVILSGGAQAKNIVWQVEGSVILGAESHAEGIILAGNEITLGAGASVTGRLLSGTAITLVSAVVTAP